MHGRGALGASVHLLADLWERIEDAVVGVAVHLSEAVIQPFVGLLERFLVLVRVFQSLLDVVLKENHEEKTMRRVGRGRQAGRRRM